jgi:hypothetical protein
MGFRRSTVGASEGWAWWCAGVCRCLFAGRIWRSSTPRGTTMPIHQTKFKLRDSQIILPLFETRIFLSRMGILILARKTPEKIANQAVQ